MQVGQKMENAFSGTTASKPRLNAINIKSASQDPVRVYLDFKGDVPQST